jgi:hypothetical protein
MTFKQAIELKQKLSNEFDNLFITPENNFDFKKYMFDFQFNNFIDTDSRRYSSNNQFNVTSIEIKMKNSYIIKKLHNSKDLSNNE